MKILVVEDSKRLRESLKKGLSALDYVVDTAEDGEIGLNYLRAYEYGLIILDIMMPNLDGVSFTKKAREIGCESSIIILSARDKIIDKTNLLDLGADDYMTKPFAYDELVARIKSLARRRCNIKNILITLEDLEVNTTTRKVTKRGSGHNGKLWVAEECCNRLWYCISEGSIYLYEMNCKKSVRNVFQI